MSAAGWFGCSGRCRCHRGGRAHPACGNRASAAASSSRRPRDRPTGQRWTVILLRLPRARPGSLLPARGRPPQAAAHRAGLEFVEKLLTDTRRISNGGAERWHAVPSPASRSPAALVELATGPGSSSSWSWSPSPNEARPQFLGDDLDGGPGAALLSGPAPLLQPE